MGSGGTMGRGWRWWGIPGSSAGVGAIAKAGRGWDEEPTGEALWWRRPHLSGARCIAFQ
jgi:hypothetical protein